ncbi:MAG: class I SAM-dependent methyltransferase [Myxococcota bacterium]|nr:class I SAM-dependent methyltransferase [Myxococcota bacterium]
MDKYKKITSDDALVFQTVSVTQKIIVDIGCGTGDLVDTLSQDAALAIGIDSKAMLDKAKTIEKQKHGKAKYLVGTAQCMPFAETSVDIFLYIASFHHIPKEDMGDALGQAANSLRPGGWVFIVEPVAEEKSYFELVQYVEDETDIQHRAYQCIKNCAPYGLIDVKEAFYYLERTIADFDRILSVFVEDRDKRRQAREKAHCRAAQLARVCNTSTEQLIFKSTCRLNLLQKI